MINSRLAVSMLWLPALIIADTVAQAAIAGVIVGALQALEYYCTKIVEAEEAKALDAELEEIGRDDNSPL